MFPDDPMYVIAFIWGILITVSVIYKLENRSIHELIRGHLLVITTLIAFALIVSVLLTDAEFIALLLFLAWLSTYVKYGPVIVVMTLACLICGCGLLSFPSSAILLFTLIIASDIFCKALHVTLPIYWCYIMCIPVCTIVFKIVGTVLIFITVKEYWDRHNKKK